MQNLFNRANLFSRNNLLKNQNYVPITKEQMIIIHYNKAPLLKDIIKFIKKKKVMLKREIDNIYNSILINESKSFITNLYITQKEKNMQPNSNLNINKSQKIFQLHRIKNNNEITGSTSKENIKNNNSVTNINNNESKILFPFLGKDKTNSNEMYHNLFFRAINKDMKNELMRSKNTSNYPKRRMEINVTLFNNLKSKENFPELGKKNDEISCYVLYKKNNLNKILSKEEYIYDKKFDIK